MNFNLRNEITEYLKEKNIYVNPEYSSYAGLIIDKLLGSSKDRPSFQFDINRITEGMEYNMSILCTDSDPNELIGYLGEDIEIQYNKVVKTYLLKNYKINIEEVWGYSKNGENHMFIHISPQQVVTTGRYNLEEISLLVAILLPALFKDAFDINTVKQCEKYLKQVESLTKSHQLTHSYILENSDIDVSELKKRAMRRELSVSIEYANKARWGKIQLSIDRAREDAQLHFLQYKEAITRLNEYLFLQQSINDGTDENLETFMDYLLCNNNIDIVDIDKSTITIEAKAYVTNYDEEWYETTTTKSNSYFGNVPAAYREDFHKLCNEIFLERKYKVRSVNEYRITIDNISSIDFCESSGSSSRQHIINKYNDRIICPHGAFNCADTFAIMWQEALEHADYVTALDYVLAFTSHINWTDYTVAECFLNDMFHFPCIRN